MVTDETVEQEAPKAEGTPAPAHGTARDLAPGMGAGKAVAAGKAADEGLEILMRKGDGQKIDLSNFKNPDPTRPRKATFGEKAHWALTYIGGDWLLNSAIGVTFTFLTSRTPWGKKYFIKPTNAFFEPMLKPFFGKNERTLQGAISGCRDFLSIMIGGTLINPILTHLEKHENKKSISKFFDTMRYGSARVEHDPKFQQAYDAIDREPVKDTSSVWYSRFIALAPLLALSTIPSTKKFMESTELPVIKYFSFDNIAKYSKKIAEGLGIKPSSEFFTEKVIHDESRKMDINRWQALHNIIGFDYGLTIFYAFLHAATFSAVARFRDNNRIQKAEKREMISPHTEGHPAAQKDDAPAVSERPEPGTPAPRVSQMAYEQLLAQPQQAAQLS